MTNHANRKRRKRRPAQRPQRQQCSTYKMVTRDETSARALVVSGLAEAVGADGEVDLTRIYVALIGRLDHRRRLLRSMPKEHVEYREPEVLTYQCELWDVLEHCG